jgi:N-acyl-D-aspartate/D-glutamate deacylase
LHGVTTIIGGNCGFTVAPLNRASADYLLRTLSKVEGIPLASLESGADWDWSSTGEYLAKLDGTLAVNAGFLVGHTALRRVVMGEDATRRHCGPDELAMMVTLLREGLAAGGLGFSTSNGAAHLDANGDPVPSRHAAPAELVALAAACRDFPGTSLEYIPGDFPFPEQDVETAISMCLAAQRPLNWNVLMTHAATLDNDLATLMVSDAAAARGALIRGLALPVDVPARLSFYTGYILDSLPGWAKDITKPFPEKLASLSETATRQRLKSLAQDRSQLPQFLNEVVDWGSKVITEVTSPTLKHYEGRIVGDIAASEGKDDFDALLDIVCADNLRTTFARPPKDSTADWEARARIWGDERVLMGGSDAGAHCDLTSQAQYTTELLGRAVREREIFTLEKAVEMITSRPADLYGLRDRGRLEVGAFADIVIFDEDRISSGPVVTRTDFPGGAAQLYADATGIDEVMVNGTTIVADGEYTQARPGRLFHSGVDTKTPALA